MRVFARAVADESSDAVGLLELECATSGLHLVLHHLAPYSKGYVAGASVAGTPHLVAWSDVEAARVGGDDVALEFRDPSFPYRRLTLTRFTSGPGAPPSELRKRRLILHLTALGLAFLAALLGGVFGAYGSPSLAAGTALGYGITLALIVLAVGYGLDQRFFLRPPSEEEVRDAFTKELALAFPRTVVGERDPAAEAEFAWPDFGALLPRTAVVSGLLLGAVLLTAVTTGRRLLEDERTRGAREPSSLAASEATPERREPAPAAAFPAPRPAESSRAEAEPAPAGDAPAETTGSHDSLTVERRCLCDRADSPLWRAPIERLSTLLLDQRTLTTERSSKTFVEVAVINNGDQPMKDITLLVEFFETSGGKLVPTKERPLYFEGPLLPGAAIKWKTDARGNRFRVRSPETGQLGSSGEGAASRDAFFALLKANNRPVRLHAAKMLAYLGDDRALESALTIKDALRTSEAPFLRRILAAVGDTRVCDVQLDVKSSPPTLGACVFNARESKVKDLALRLELLDGALDVAQPLANPPALLVDRTWTIPGELPPQSGAYARLVLSKDLVPTETQTVEVTAGREGELD